jgi:hypothetical protein
LVEPVLGDVTVTRGVVAYARMLSDNMAGMASELKVENGDFIEVLRVPEVSGGREKIMVAILSTHHTGHCSSVVAETGIRDQYKVENADNPKLAREDMV